MKISGIIEAARKCRKCVAKVARPSLPTLREAAEQFEAIFLNEFASVT